MVFKGFMPHSTLTAVKISFACFLKMAGNKRLSFAKSCGCTEYHGLPFPGSTHWCATKKQYLRESTASFQLKQVPFTQSTYHVYLPLLPKPHSHTRWICCQPPPRRGSHCTLPPTAPRVTFPRKSSACDPAPGNYSLWASSAILGWCGY